MGSGGQMLRGRLAGSKMGQGRERMKFFLFAAVMGVLLAMAPPCLAENGTAALSAADRLLKTRDFEGAEKAYRAIIAGHPQEAVAGLALFGLGETFFGRNEFGLSALAYSDSYREFPQGKRAAEALFKLGVSMGRMGRTAEACLAFKGVRVKFPALADPLRARVNQEKKRAGCS